MSADVTFGFVKDAKDHIDVQGFNVYHKNRLIKSAPDAKPKTSLGDISDEDIVSPHVLVFTRNGGQDFGRPTQSIGMLSYTFLMETGKQDIVVPM
nr:protein microrchidia 7 [Tanacetum cinerariifolium]